MMRTSFEGLCFCIVIACSACGEASTGSVNAPGAEATQDGALVDAGRVPVGAACTSLSECAPGATCTLREGGGGGVCRALCVAADGGNPTCPLADGGACERVSEFGCCRGCACIAVSACK